MKDFLIDCEYVMNINDEIDKDTSLPILTQARLSMHLLFCEDCQLELKNLQNAEEIMRTDFLPPSPEFEDIIMKKLGEEVFLDETMKETAGVSFKSWVIIGFFLVVSLVSTFFGMNFVGIPNGDGLSFLLPVGITIGIIVTCYGALFIGSHLKELSNRFGLR